MAYAGRTAVPSVGLAETVRTLALLWLAGASLRATILALPPVLPQVSADLGLQGGSVGVLTALPSLLFAAAAVPSARIIARLGAVPTLTLGLLLNALGAAARGFTGSGFGLEAATFLMCLGIAVMQPALPPLVRAWAPNRIGFATAVYTNGLLIGEVLPTAWVPQGQLPLIGDGWRAALAAWAVLPLTTGILVAALGRRPATGDGSATARWWPDWRDARVWRLGMLLGGINATYFGLNGFLPGWMAAQGTPELVQPLLIALNLGQIPASLLLLFFAERLVRKPLAYGVAGAVMLASVIGVVATSGSAALAWAALCGFFLGGLLTLALALPSLIGAAEDVPRLSAAMFTVSYTLAMLASLLAGWLWSWSGTVLAAFAPAAAAALLTTGLGFSLRADELDHGKKRPGAGVIGREANRG